MALTVDEQIDQERLLQAKLETKSAELKLQQDADLRAREHKDLLETRRNRRVIAGVVIILGVVSVSTVALIKASGLDKPKQCVDSYTEFVINADPGVFQTKARTESEFTCDFPGQQIEVEREPAGASKVFTRITCRCPAPANTAAPKE